MATRKSKTSTAKTLYVYSSNIQAGQFEAFEKWIGENKQRFAAAQPEAWTLKDVYLTAFALGPAHVEIHWEIEGYRALDLARSNAARGGAFFDLLTKVHSFLDPTTGSARLLKSASSEDTLIVGC
jgi:hypothetical protein